MIDNRYVPAHLIASYVWEILDANTRMEKINGVAPIIALNDSKMLAESGKPYVIYGYAEAPVAGGIPAHRGVFTGRVIAPNYSHLVEILGAVGRAFESEDVSTENINIWSSSHEVMINGTPTPVDFEGIRFTLLKSSHIDGAEPSDEESDDVVGTFSLDYEYISRQEVVLPVSNGLWK